MVEAFVGCVIQIVRVDVGLGGQRWDGAVVRYMRSCIGLSFVFAYASVCVAAGWSVAGVVVWQALAR